jgi:ribosomal protein S18 acetylase RimI-like enzyme
MEKLEVIVRKASACDVEEIRILASDSFRIYAENAEITEFVAPLNESYDKVKSEVETKNVFVALVNGKIIGSLRIEVKSDNTAYLSKFGISSLYQNYGVGKMLMKAVDESMEDIGIDKLYLHTSSRMFSLIKFYYGGGFYIESTTKDRGYIRALLCKEYKTAKAQESLCTDHKNQSIM